MNELLELIEIQETALESELQVELSKVYRDIAGLESELVKLDTAISAEQILVAVEDDEDAFEAAALAMGMASTEGIISGIRMVGRAALSVIRIYYKTLWSGLKRLGTVLMKIFTVKGIKLGYFESKISKLPVDVEPFDVLAVYPSDKEDKIKSLHSTVVQSKLSMYQAFQDAYAYTEELYQHGKRPNTDDPGDFKFKAKAKEKTFKIDSKYIRGTHLGAIFRTEEAEMDFNQYLGEFFGANQFEKIHIATDDNIIRKDLMNRSSKAFTKVLTHAADLVAGIDKTVSIATREYGKAYKAAK